MAEASSHAEDDPVAMAEARVGTSLNAKWTLERLLGVGGMGAAFAARHRNGTRAAVKLLHAQYARESNIRERFLREGRIANKVDHPARVPVTDDDVSDKGEPFLVMDLLEGGTLDQLRRRTDGILPLEETLRIFDTVLDLLARCHAVGIVHRDIKPGNIFITDDGSVKVLDFGVARMRGPDSGVEATRLGMAIGTASCIAPEQALGLGAQVDGRSDIFSVGACMYVALTGKRLNQARTEAESFVMAATQKAPSIANLAPDLPVEVVACVDRALAFEPEKRFQDAASMRSEVLGLLAALRAGQLVRSAPRKDGGPAAEPTLESGGLDLSDLLGTPVTTPASPAVSEPRVEPKTAEPRPARRRDPRNDTLPPAGLVEQVLRPVPVIKRLVSLNVALPDPDPLQVPPTPASTKKAPPSAMEETPRPKKATLSPKKATQSPKKATQSPKKTTQSQKKTAPAPKKTTQSQKKTAPGPKQAPSAEEFDLVSQREPVLADRVPPPAKRAIDVQRLPPPAAAAPRAAVLPPPASPSPVVLHPPAAPPSRVALPPPAAPPKRAAPPPPAPPPKRVAPPPPPPVASPRPVEAAPPSDARLPSFGPDEGVDAFLDDALRERSLPPPPKDPEG